MEDPFPYLWGDMYGSGENLIYLTNPNSRLRDGSTDSGIEILNITWKEVAKNCTLDITHTYNPNFNIIAENTTWSGMNVIDRDTYIMGGAKLTLAEGCIVKVNKLTTKIKIVVMPGGILESEGTENNPVEIISSETLPTNNDWQGLELINKHSLLEGGFLVVRHAEYAVTFKDRFNYDFQYITFENNNTSFSLPPSPDGDLKINTSHCRFIDSPINYLNYSNGDVEFRFENCFFTGSSISIANPTSVIFKNNLLADNSTITSQKLSLINNIFYDFSINYFVQSSSPGDVQYNCLYSINSSQDISLFHQPGNFSADPQFVNPQGPQPDYHLLETSPCIDSGDPLADYSQEPGNNGGRINIGLYGNTPEATQTNPLNPPSWDSSIIFLGDFIGTGIINALPGLTAQTADGKQVKIKGTLNASGNQSSGILFTAYNTGGQWKGLFADVGSQISFEYCIIENSTKGLFNNFQSEPAILPDLSVSHSTIQNNEMGSELFYSLLEFQDNTYSNNSSTAFYANLCQGTLYGNQFESNGKGLDVNRCQLTISGNIISNNDAAGVFLSWDQGSTLDNNTIENNGYVPGDLPWSERSGITLYRSSPLLWENTIQNNRGNGLLAFASSIPVLNAKDEANLNLVKNNGTDPISVQFPYESSELYFHDYAQPEMANGHNDIIDESNANEDNYLFYLEPEDNPDISINISRNYWGMDESNFNYERFYLLDILVIDPYNEDPNVHGGLAKTGSKTGGGGVNHYSFGKTGAVSALDSLFHQAVVLEDSGLFGEAYNQYFSILQSYPDSAVSYSSIPRLIRCGLKSGVSTQDLKNNLNDLHSASSYPYILKQTPAFINECEIVEEEFPVVINNLNQILADSIAAIDSLYAELDLSSVLLLSGQTGSSKTNGLNGITSIAAFSSFRDHIFEQVLNRASSNNQAQQTLTTFALAQNYPNPFNPVTTIQYQLPKSGKVRLEIFNILGQKMKTLINARQKADFYTIQWSGDNNAGNQVSSGLYIYRLTITAEKDTEKFVSVKKMLLVR